MLTTTNLTIEQRQFILEVRSKMDQLKKAFDEMEALWANDHNHDIDLNELLVSMYPFDNSFDELTASVAIWHESAANLITASLDKPKESPSSVAESDLIVKSFDGKTDVNVKAMQHSLRVDFPSFARKNIDDQGTPFLDNCVFSDSLCGCTVEGNGTLQFPLRVNFCEKHSH